MWTGAGGEAVLLSFLGRKIPMWHVRNVMELTNTQETRNLGCETKSGSL